MPSTYAEESTVSKQRVTTLVLSSLAIIFLILRLISRKLKRVQLGLDDWTLILGLIFVLVCAGLNYASTYFGMGRHMVPAMQEGIDIGMFFKLLYVFEPIYITNVAIIKFSVLLMYNRIFPVRSIRLGSYILGGITLAWVISVDLVAIFQCTPVQKAWNRQLPGTCIDLKAALIGNGAPNFITDILILALPGRSIWKLQTSLWQRVSIIAVFLSGSFVVFASIYRFSLIFILDMNDIPWTLADAQTWCVVETSAGIISACLPTIVPLIRLLARGVMSTTSSPSKSGTNAQSQSRSKNTRGLQPSDSKNNLTGPRSQNADVGFDFGLDGDSVPLKEVDRGSERGRGGRASVSPGHGHGIKAQGWTVIRASGDSD
ncbi:hypothetical protein BJY04DRAFT_217914 [Aspergillus karnatakaensis]|uniref:uncharacterized protein n=1 Tax=Aspergillus karnatakaensis TaxID=1810916 RepID=UPI003CCDDEEF